ncbi:MAG TPA: hypothetical protein VN408_04820 [Actinoplanes sp.]|nr:hypothetical protein [Actinoplanes sp.]
MTQANLPSINDNANVLVELAGALGAARPDADLSRTGCQEALDDEINQAIRSFADFSYDQYQDVVALLAALSTKLKNTSAGYQQTDEASAALLDDYLTGSVYMAPEQR